MQPKKPTIHMIGTTHFDPVWMWTWDEAMASIRSTFRSALDRMQEDPDFIYSFSCPPVFEWVRKVDPELFAEIRRRVQEGRWDLVEGWWVQPDCNLPSGESLVRQGLYGQRYLMRHFGRQAVAAFNTDSFGHNVMLPQILRKSGMLAYVFGRPSEAYLPLPGPLFVWRSPDGCSILAYRCGSDGANSYSQDVKSDIATLGEHMAALDHDRLMLYGVSNHGGAPTRQAIADINGFRESGNRDFAVRFSAIADFFSSHDETRLPVVTDELQTRDFGVFVNHSEVKTRNRRAEYAVLRAESLSALAGADAAEQAALQSAWQDVLFNQFHDILGGASVQPAYDDARNLHGRALQTVSEITHYRLQSITKSIDTQFEGFPLVVYNPNPFVLEGGIEAELQWAWEFPWYSGDLTLVDPDGKTIPCQIIQERSGLPRFRSRFVFRDRIPSMGYRVYAVRQEAQPAVTHGHLSVSTDQIENARYRIRIDQAAGAIAEIWDKRMGRTILHEAGLPRMLADAGDTWAFNIDGFGEEVAPFKPESIEVIENGPVRALVRIKSRCADSTFEQDILLYRDAETIEGRFRVHWREKRRALKLCFRMAADAPVLTSAVPYGSIERPTDGREMPAGEWLSLDADQWGIGLVSDSVFAYTATGSTLGLSILRSPIFAHHGHPKQRNHIDETRDYAYIDQGCREGRWQLGTHAGDWRSAQLPLQAVAFNNPALTVTEANHPGNRPREAGMLKVDAQSTLLTVVKNAEDGEHIVLRLYEYAGRVDQAKIVLRPFNASLTLEMQPHEIKTVLLDPSNPSRVIETNLLEHPVPQT